MPHAEAATRPDGLAELACMVLALALAQVSVRVLTRHRKATGAFSIGFVVLLLAGAVSAAVGAVAVPILCAVPVGLAIGFLIADLRILHRSPWPLRRRGLAGVVSIAAFALVWLGIGTPLALTVLLPAVSRIAHQDERAGIGETLVSFRARDGTVLRGTLSTGGTAVPVLLLHGHADGRSRMEPWARALASEGHPTLRFDHRAHGASGGGVCTLADREVDDAVRAARQLASRAHAGRVVLFGASMGGGIALVAARALDAAARRGEEPRAAGVIALAPASDYGEIVRAHGLRGPLFSLGALAMNGLGLRSFASLVPADSVPSDVPILVIHSRDDGEIPYWLSTRLAVHANVGVELVDGIAHDQIPAQSLARAALRSLIEDFIASPTEVVRQVRRHER